MNTLRQIALLFFTTAFVACGGGNGGSPTPDGTADLPAAETTPGDVAGPDAGPLPDVPGSPDTPPTDLAADAAPDLGRPDAEPDLGRPDAAPGPDAATPDLMPDGGGVADTLPPTDLGSDTVPPPDAGPPDAVVPDGGPDAPPADLGGGDTAPPPDVDPYAAGPYGVEERTASVPRSDGSSIAVDIYLPNDRSGAPYPVVFLNHGFQLSGADFASYGERLASHGFVAFLPTTGDSLFSARTHVELAEDVGWLIDWLIAESDDFEGQFYELVELGQLGVGGHSRGGKQSIFAATRDTRIRASFNLDPVDSGPPFGGNAEDFPSVAPEMMGDFLIPGGFVGAGRAAQSSFGQACAPAEDNYHQYYAAAPGPDAYEYAIPDAGHLDFVDDCGFLCFTCTGGDDPAWTRAFATATLVAFYRVFLAGDERYRPWVDGAPVTTLAPRVAFSSH